MQQYGMLYLNPKIESRLQPRTLNSAADESACIAVYAIAPLRVTGALLVEVRARAREAHLISTTCTVLQVYGSNPCNVQPPATQRQQAA